jgi:hypothetical protein
MQLAAAGSGQRNPILTALANRRAGVTEMTAIQSSVLLAQERKQFRLIFGVAFVVFLALSLVARALPRRWRPWVPAGDRRLSLIGEARALTNTVIPFAFL